MQIFVKTRKFLLRSSFHVPLWKGLFVVLIFSVKRVISFYNAPRLEMSVSDMFFIICSRLADVLWNLFWFEVT